MQYVEDPLTEDEMDELAALLEELPSDDAMSLEMVDGYFAAIIAGPEHPPASEYLPRVYGFEPGDETPPFEDAEKSARIAELLQRHWRTMAAQLFRLLEKDEVYVPIMAEDEEGNALGNEWAAGFLIGTELRPHAWQELYEDDSRDGLLAPMLQLAHEHDPDPERRTPPISPQRRAALLDEMAWNVTLINRYYADHRLTGGKPREPFRREGGKVGRNDPCPCGSGKKYKRCCGAAAH
ncbi:MAG: UPF0149 family protein [Burkholderiales bacterium]|nr:UPF0149 family protein [Burkholderiales bacterium]PZN02702.1 MAG: YecA family protein [Pseudomonadota bacterium]